MKKEYEIILDVELPEKAEQPIKQTVLQVKDLQKELLVLRLAFGQLKAAIADAAAPVAAVVVPVVTGAVRAATRLVKTLGQVAAGVLGVQAAQVKVQKTLVRTAAAAKRTVASFDQLNRLQATGGSSTVTSTAPVAVKTTLSPQVQETVNQINALLEPLKNMDLSPVQWCLARLQDALKNLWTQAGTTLGGLWHQVLVPFVTWVTEKLSPVLLNLATGAVKLLTVAMKDAGDGFGAVWQAAQPMAEFLGTAVLNVIDQVRRLFAHLRIAMATDSASIGQVLESLGNAMHALWALIDPVLNKLRTAFAMNFEQMGQVAIRTVGYLLDAVAGLLEFFTGLFADDWDSFWGGLSKACKSSINAVISLLNGLLGALTKALNSLFKLLNKISITVPEWVPEYGGKTFGLSLKSVTAPQIPYLAKGAVLPANQPFLAVVGDQCHGTNVEAPLATIQEAVALVMSDQLSALQAGFDATVQQLQLLRQTVGSIEVGDTVIGAAAERYQAKLAVLRGGQF